MSSADSQAAAETLLAKALNLFTFLGKAQSLSVKPIRRTSAYEDVLWFADLPDHAAVASGLGGPSSQAVDALFTIERVPKVSPPPLEADLVEWVDGPIDDPQTAPALHSSVYRESQLGPDRDESIDAENLETSPVQTVWRIENNPRAAEAFEKYLEAWSVWAELESQNAVVRDLYHRLFSTQLRAEAHGEEFELVLGIGCLAWEPENHDQVQRHVITAPVSISLDDTTAAITVATESSVDAQVLELDMLDPSIITNPAKIDEIRTLVREYDSSLLDEQEIGQLLRRLVHRLDPEGEYVEDALEAPTGMSPRVHLAPAIILRKRSARGIVDIYNRIVEQLRATGEVPTGIIPLIDPDHVPDVGTDSTPGSMVTLGEEVFLPLPVNDKQLQVVQRVSRSAQTLVQGPPGTGKTHTASALVSHLLAQGKRVLITAHTERALYEVREKLPMAIQPLAVSIIGKSRSDMSDLRVAVEKISARSAEFDQRSSDRAIEQHLERIDQLRRERSSVYSKLLRARVAETETVEYDEQQGTLAAIALEHLSQSSEFSWLSDLGVDASDPAPPITNQEFARWIELIRDARLTADEPEAVGRLDQLDQLPPPDEFGRLVGDEAGATSAEQQHELLLTHEAFGFVSSLEPSVRQELTERIRILGKEAEDLEARHEVWLSEALQDVRTGRKSTWVARRQELLRIGDQASKVIDLIGYSTTVEVASENVDVLVAMAQSLHEHVASGGKVKVLPDGSPKVGALAGKVVKASEPLFNSVKVNGLAPTRADQLAAFLNWAEAKKLIAAMDKAWPSSVVRPEEDTLREELQWNLTEAEQLDKVLLLGDHLSVEQAWFEANSLPVPDWSDLRSIREYGELVEAAAATDMASAARAPFEQLERLLEAEQRWPDAPQCVTDLLSAVVSRDFDQYLVGFERLERLRLAAVHIAERDRIRAAFLSRAPRVVAAVESDPHNEAWSERLGAFEEAWRWDSIGSWILGQDSTDINVLQQQLARLESSVRSEVEHLAAERAWAHAVSGDRLTGGARADLTQYAQLVTRLGKGTGKYAGMDRCRPAVPVWIMPIYRLAEQITVEPDLFDVVIVDEASQAGLEATFLQYLAPKIVVIGDDKQVSPQAVGLDQQKLRDLANQYLATDRYKGTWLDPKRSLFDEAKMRFGGLVTLTEHRRCVPEIIGFSNRIAYEPEGIRLVPVRQFGADRLDPIQVVHVADGYSTRNNTNPAEADAIVEQIEKCFADPRYDGCTIGVISLLGPQQARLIEGILMERIDPEEWRARDIRCGDATDFQGSERDIMFLSMVKSLADGERYSPMTRDDAVQRFNVAASRAKDQMWVYHSLPREALTNSADMRFQLLDYCYGVVNRLETDAEGSVRSVVSETFRVDPFDSLFEQRVCNRILERGFTVFSQWDANGYKIDLVIVGAKGRLAVECDGDFWHGPDAYERDLARQRDLERCNWEFFRIRESAFYADMAGSMAKLWETLDELDIHPANWVAPDLETPHGSEPIEPTEPARIDDAVEPEPGVDDSLPVVIAADDEQTGRHANRNDVNVFAVLVPTDQSGEPVRAEGDGFPNLNEAGASQSGAITELERYQELLGELRSTPDDAASQIAADIVKVVAAEGPVMGYRLHVAYVKAIGKQRVGKEVARSLNRAIAYAESKKLIVSDNPLNEAGVKPKIYRLSSTPPVVPRSLGPRSLDQVPPSEIAHHMAAVILRDPEIAEDDLLRGVLERLGLRRLTENTRAILEKARALIE
jgi:very-short-patch-repair endonuclease/DNA polymerase III delta prime subunit